MALKKISDAEIKARRKLEENLSALENALDDTKCAVDNLQQSMLDTDDNKADLARELEELKKKMAVFIEDE